MQFFTAVFGESHRIAAHGLIRSFRMHEPEAALTVFTDLSDLTPDGVDASLGQLLSGRERFYDRPGRRNIFKFVLFAEMFERHPGEVIVWVDADALVLDRISSQLDPSKLNVISHGKRDDETVVLGNGVEVAGARYAISGLFSLPDPSWLDLIDEVVADRPSWNHLDHDSNLGDQLILNHVLADTEPSLVNWLSDDRERVYNLEIADGLHPYVNDPRLASLTRIGGSAARVVSSMASLPLSP